MVKPVLQREGSTQTTGTLSGLSVVIPVYKEDAKLVTQTYCDLTMLGAEVIIVDDGGTVDLDDSIHEIEYQPNMGYGYALKRGIQEATNSIVLTADGDGQHSVEDIEKLYTVFKLDKDFAMVVGSRWNLHEPGYRWFSRKCLNFLASIISGHYMVDLNSGLRAFRKDLAISYSQILCDTFSFTTSRFFCIYRTPANTWENY